MKSRKWLILLLVIVTMMSLATYTGVTRSVFIDDEQSTEDTLLLFVPQVVLDDGFEVEGILWDANWDDYGPTTWIQDSAKPHTGTYNARISNAQTPGYLTSDDLDSAGTSIIYVSFWFNLKSLDAGDCVLQRYNGSTWTTWYDLLDYPTYANNVWCQFNEEITDLQSQYFKGNFKIRFDASALGGSTEEANIDDVLISTFDSIPAAPTGLVATLGDTEVSLDWNDNSEGDIDGYNVYRSETPSGPYTTPINASLVAASEYTDTGLTNDVTYYYVVTAVDFGSNESDYSNEDSATPTDLPPAAPIGLVATSGNEEVTLNWDDNTEGDLDGYNVYRSETPGGPYSKVNSSLLTPSDYTDTELTYDVTYYYVVRAVDLTSNESGDSNEDSAIANNIAPVAPIGLVATPGDKEVSLDWNDNSEGDLDGYNVYRSTDSGGSPTPYSKVNGSLVASSDYTDTGLTNGVTYYYVVTAVDTYAAESGYSLEGDATPVNAPPAAPTGLAAISDNAEISLDWNDNSEGDLDGYNVYRSTDSGGSPTPYAKINVSLVALSEYTDTGLTNNVTYYYVVTAVDTEAAPSVYSSEVSATPIAPVFLDDGFEGDPWDDNWNNNGTTTWVRDAGSPNSGTYNAMISNSQTPGYLTSDDIDASASTTGITVNFWFNLKSLEAGDLIIEIYDGTWTTWYDLINYPTYVNNVWCEFSEILSDPGYFISGFRIRFDASALGGTTEEANIDDVLIITDSIPPAAPTGLGATPGDTEVSLDWSDNSESDLDGYNVYRSETMGGPYSKVNGSLVETSDYTDTGLTNDVTYYYVVTAVDLGNNESGYSSEVSAIPVDLAPAAPTGLVATAGDEEISLDWNDNSEGDIDGYDVYRSTDSGGSPTPYAKINASLVALSQYTDTGLYGGGTYYYVVKAVDLADPIAYESGYSDEDSATANDVAPAAPTGLVATPGNRQASLDWNDNSEDDIDGYNVYRNQTGGEPYNKIASLVALSEYTDTGLTGGVTYYYVVTAVDNGSNESGNSNEASATPTDATPSAPTGLVATPGDRQASLNWNDNSEDDIDGYNVHRSETQSGPYTQINVSLASTSDYTDTGLTGGVTYYYVVTAVDLGSNESGYSSEVSAIPTDAAPAAPTGLVATSGEAEISLDWNNNAEDDIDGYNVYRSLTTGEPYSQINVSLVATSDYTDTDVTNGVTYYYVVTAVDLVSNESGYSNEDSAIPTDAAPAAPTGLVATPGDRQASLDWNDNTEPDIDGYNVYRSLTSGSGYAYIDSSVTSAYTDTGLTGGVTYYYVVRAVDLADPVAYESGDSNEASAIPVDLAPVAPTGLLATKGVGQVSLDWNDNAEDDIDGYNVYRNQTGGEPYTKIASLVALSEYTDSDVTNGVTYYYVVTAVDLVSNESGYSNEDSARPVGPPQILLDDGFEVEGTSWADNWNDNGITTWIQDSSKPNSGNYNANISNKGTPGYLTSDDLDTFAAETITVSFWFNLKGLDAGDCVLQRYNGSTWTTWYDLLDYPTYVNNAWCQFSETITDSQYFISNFRIRFDSSVLGDSTEQANIDDVLIAINQ